MTTISKNLRKLREKTPFQQEDMAIKLGIKQNTYCTWESGKADVKSEYLPQIAEILGVEIKDLFKNETSKIELIQNYTENKDNSINGLVFILSDKESVEKLVDVFKNAKIKNL
jgi:transcriptional regulator with XRE-family HTH domain